VLILLIEDDAFKAKRICAFLQEKFPSHKTIIGRSVSAGLSRLFDAPAPDIVLLDMSLSTFDVGPRETGGRPQNFGGISILDHMLRKKLHLPVVVITQFESFPKGNQEVGLDDVRGDLANRFSGIFKGLIYYSSRETHWEADLTNLLNNSGVKERRHENFDRG